MTERELERRPSGGRRVADVEAVSGNVAATCGRYGISRQCGHIAVRSCQVVARAFALIWSNSAWVIVPASRSCLADAI